MTFLKKKKKARLVKKKFPNETYLELLLPENKRVGEILALFNSVTVIPFTEGDQDFLHCFLYPPGKNTHLHFGHYLNETRLV